MDIYQNGGMRIQNIHVFGWEGAVIGMRMPMNSEKLSDSIAVNDNDIFSGLGQKDIDLIIRLTRGGTDHAKVLRCIHVQAEVKMPMTWWAHYDTYKVGTTAISRSRMHRLTSRLLGADDFFVAEWTEHHQYVVDIVNNYIDEAIGAKELGNSVKALACWRKALDMLPMWYCQERFIDLNYQVLVAQLNSRYKVEKLSIEWNFYCEAFLKYCPLLCEIWHAAKAKRSLTTQEFSMLEKK